MLAAAKLRGDEVTASFHLVIVPPRHKVAQAQNYMPNS